MLLDLSQFDISTFDAACMKAAGVDGVILGVFSGENSPDGMAEVAKQCVNAGITIHGFYGLVYFGSPYGSMRDTRYAIALAKQFGVKRVWIDCEIDGVDIGFTDAHRPTQAERVTEIRNAVRAVEEAGLKAGIYSGAWWWGPRTGDTKEFSHLPLWHASYFDDGRKVRNVSYGGWSECAIHQWTSSLEICGRHRDANHVWDTSVLEGDDEMTPEERARLERLEAIIAGNGLLVDVEEHNKSTLQQIGLESPIIGTRIKLTGERALEYSRLRGFSFAFGLVLLTDRVAQLEVADSAGTGAPAEALRVSLSINGKSYMLVPADQ